MKPAPLLEVPSRSESPDRICLIRRRLFLFASRKCRRSGTVEFAEPTWLTNDPVLVSQLAALRELAFMNREDGADLRTAAKAVAPHSFLVRWLVRSDALVDELAAPIRLKTRRRRGILRHLHGPLRGLPFFQPPLELYRTSECPEPRTFPLWDELEWIVMSGRIDELGWRPAKDEITFDEARAWTGMKSATLYYHTSKRNVPGQKWRSLGDDPDSNLRELRFETEHFRHWAIVSDIG